MPHRRAAQPEGVPGIRRGRRHRCRPEHDTHRALIVVPNLPGDTHACVSGVDGAGQIDAEPLPRFEDGVADNRDLERRRQYARGKSQRARRRHESV